MYKYEIYDVTAYICTNVFLMCYLIKFASVKIACIKNTPLYSPSNSSKKIQKKIKKTPYTEWLIFGIHTENQPTSMAPNLSTNSFIVLDWVQGILQKNVQFSWKLRSCDQVT